MNIAGLVFFVNELLAHPIDPEFWIESEKILGMLNDKIGTHIEIIIGMLFIM